ncbi:ATP synthase F1 [Nemania sp. NC0429]|nr:ATP synthase F1 [Nemania sp. NC0429]
MASPSPVERVALWELNTEVENESVLLPKSALPCIHTSGVVEIGIFEPPADIRVAVQERDAKLGGKYHSVVKLFFLQESSETWTTATGWLLSTDVVVTSAHCVYGNGKRAVSVKAFLGYDPSGEGSQQRSVSRIVLPLDWIDNGAEQRDVAFLHLDAPFQNISPLAYCTTEVNAHHDVTVVGFAADLREDGEPGARMYEMAVSRDIDLEHTKWNMLAYQGDLHGGFSGSPVIRDRDLTVIGVHCRGGTFNSAVAIGGAYGVRFEIYEKVARSLEGNKGLGSGLDVKTHDTEEWLKCLDVSESV